jgi:hypothetical protein
MKIPAAASAFLALLLLAATASAQEAPDRELSRGVEHRVFFAPGDPELESLRAADAVLRIEDYGSFAMAVVDERRAGGRTAFLERGLDVRDDQAVVSITAFALDTADRETLAARLASIPERLRAREPERAAAGDSLWIVQFAGPIRDAWLERLAATGAFVVSPLATNAYVVLVDAASIAPFADFARDPSVQWIGAYHPFFKLAPGLRALDFGRSDTIDVTVQAIAAVGAARVEDLLRRSGPMLRPVERVLGFVNLRFSVAVSLLPALAADPAVFGIEPSPQLVLHDEIQCQELAGNINALQNGPSAPGYLAWLGTKGFAQTGQFNFVVDVTDSGLDRGSITDVNNEFKALGAGGASRVIYAVNHTTDPLADCPDGHGNLAASIVGGYNALTGSAYEDAAGYNYGLGICPFVQLGGTKCFDSLGAPTGFGSTTHAQRLSAAYAAGARVSTNSWGWTNSGGFYGVDSQAHDALVRDAQPTGIPGNQELVIAFSSGNDGGPGTVAPPGAAKNVITVGASESNRQTGTDGCAVDNAGANNINDVVYFSSRGPTLDNRKKPDVMAPGTHIQGAQSRSLTYNAGGVCNFSWPIGQSLYTWASGTSFSCPAIGGAAALIRQWFLNQAAPAPSPALTKAILMCSTRYMTGASANDALWSNNQGMGFADLGRAFDSAQRIFVDQTHVFGASGQTYVVNGTIASSMAPFRVGLVWTDTPGPTTGNAYVNNLDLQVNLNGTIYRGNIFTGANSTTGGAADFRNNAEFVFLAAGATGPFTITVTATNIAGDGVPGNADATDQDFALVVYNGGTCSPSITSVSPPQITPPLATPTQITVTGACFGPNSVVHANCVPLTTTYVNQTTLNCTLPTSIPQTQIPGALCINVQNGVVVSNSVALRCGPGNNQGTMRRDPLVPTPGGFYSLLIEGGAPFAPFTLVGDLGTVTPVPGFPDAANDYVLAVTPATGSAGPLVPVLDGLGLFGPAGPFALDGAGKFTIPGIYLPSPPVGITATLQVAYLDPTSPLGVRLTWARFPEQL